MSAVDSRITTERIIALERAALDRWGQGDPGGFLELYGDSWKSIHSYGNAGAVCREGPRARRLRDDAPVAAGNGGTTSPTLTLEGMTPREVLDRLMETQPEFGWQDVDGVVRHDAHRGGAAGC